MGFKVLFHKYIDLQFLCINAIVKNFIGTWFLDDIFYFKNYGKEKWVLDQTIITMIKFSRIIRTLSRTTHSYRFCTAIADPYYILGVERNAPFPEIKKAFYRLASEFHPDRNSSQVSFSSKTVSAEEIRCHQTGLWEYQNGEGTDEASKPLPFRGKDFHATQSLKIFCWLGGGDKEYKGLYGLWGEDGRTGWVLKFR